MAVHTHQSDFHDAVLDAVPVKTLTRLGRTDLSFVFVIVCHEPHVPSLPALLLPVPERPRSFFSHTGAHASMPCLVTRCALRSCPGCTVAGHRTERNASKSLVYPRGLSEGVGVFCLLDRSLCLLLLTLQPHLPQPPPTPTPSVRES
jgi:hypothetical protein